MESYLRCGATQIRCLPRHRGFCKVKVDGILAYEFAHMSYSAEMSDFGVYQKLTLWRIGFSRAEKKARSLFATSIIIENNALAY